MRRVAAAAQAADRCDPRPRRGLSRPAGPDLSPAPAARACWPASPGSGTAPSACGRVGRGPTRHRRTRETGRAAVAASVLRGDLLRWGSVREIDRAAGAPAVFTAPDRRRCSAGCTSSEGSTLGGAVIDRTLRGLPGAATPRCAPSRRTSRDRARCGARTSPSSSGGSARRPIVPSASSRGVGTFDRPRAVARAACGRGRRVSDGSDRADDLLAVGTPDRPRQLRARADPHPGQHPAARRAASSCASPTSTSPRSRPTSPSCSAATVEAVLGRPLSDLIGPAQAGRRSRAGGVGVRRPARAQPARADHRRRRRPRSRSTRSCTARPGGLLLVELELAYRAAAVLVPEHLPGGARRGRRAQPGVAR